MSYIVKQGEDINYRYKEIIIDTEADLASVETEDVCPGSIVYVVNSGAMYMLNTKGEWIKQLGGEA